MLNNWFHKNKEYFFGEIWGQQDCLFRNDSEETIPFDLEKLETILNYYPLTYENLKLFGNGGVVPVRMYTKSLPNQLNPVIDKEKLLAPDFLKEKTLVINQIHLLDAELNQWHKQLEQAFGCSVNMNLYYSNGNISGVNAHYDLHHIFAAQINGQKVWQIGDVVVDNPNSYFHPYIDEAPFHKEVITKGGDFLYLPPGQWHSVDTVGHSLHLAIGLHPPTWTDYIQKALIQVTEKHAIYRQHLPFYIENNQIKFQTEVENEIQQLLQVIAMEKVEFPKNTPSRIDLKTIEKK